MAAQGTADSLYIDPTSVYQPALNDIEKQKIQANKRYETNAADVKNIFGNLSTVSAEDAVRIKQQYIDTITDQQMRVAQRTAEVRNAQAAGKEQQAISASERGTGAVTPSGGPEALAAEQGIARSNAYQTIWEGLQNANQLQAQQNISARGAGYGQQQVSAMTNLKANLESALSQLGGKQSEIQSQLAQAKLSGQQNVANAKYQESQNAKAQAANSAAAAAQAQSDAVQASINANKGTLQALQGKMVAQGYTGQIKAVSNQSAKAYDRAWDKLNKDNDGKNYPWVKPTPADIKAEWVKLARERTDLATKGQDVNLTGLTPDVQSYVYEYIDLTYGK